MRWFLMFAASGCLALLAGCSGMGSSLAGGSHPSGTGPFDSRGNYVEEWADSPSKWRRRSSHTTESQLGPDLVAHNDQIKVSPPSKPQTLARNDTPAPKPRPETRTRPDSKPSTEVSSRPKPKPQPEVASVTPKPKPKTVASKPKPKKPSSTRVTIKQGDTLSGLARRYGTTVGAIKRANGLSGDLIRAGKTLVIPRK